jgi:hypothetical protein
MSSSNFIGNFLKKKLNLGGERGQSFFYKFFQMLEMLRLRVKKLHFWGKGLNMQEEFMFSHCPSLFLFFLGNIFEAP